MNSTTGQLNFVSVSKLFYGFVSVKLTWRIYVDYIFRLFFRSLLIRAKKGIIFLGRCSIICSTGPEWKIVQIPPEFLKFSVERSFFILQHHDIHYKFPRKFLVHYSKNPHTRTCGLRTHTLKFGKKGTYIYVKEVT